MGRPLSCFWECEGKLRGNYFGVLNSERRTSGRAVLTFHEMRAFRYGQGLCVRKYYEATALSVDVA